MTWVDLQGLEKEVRQRKTNTKWFHLNVECKKQTNKQSKTETHLQIQRIIGSFLRVESGGVGTLGEGG